MSNYCPDNWILIAIKGEDPHYRVLAGWSGGYLDGDSWKINSGIVRIEETLDRFYFYGDSGSVYECRKSGETLRMNIAHVWNRLKELHGNKIDRIESKDFIKIWSNYTPTPEESKNE